VNIIVNILKKLNVIPAPLVDTQSQIIRARALMEANRLGVFTALEEAGNGLSAEEVADNLDLSREGVDVLLKALTGVGYLNRRNGRYRNGPWVKRWILDPERGLSNMLTLQFHTWARLDNLGETLRTGRPAMDYHQIWATTPSEGQEIYTRAMREIARMMLPEFLKRVKLPPEAKRLLDIGGAHGEYSRAMVGRFPGLQATVLDLAGPISTAQQLNEAAGNPENIKLRVGDALKDDLGAGWDAALLANVVHIFNPTQNQDLFKRIYHALNPGGVLIATDQFLGLGDKRDEITGLLSLNFFNAGGRCYSFSEMEHFLEDAGFKDIKAKPFPLWLPSSLIEAWK
jgi:SAM-dependent methyltransferase